MADRLRVGVIGAGKIAELGHLPGFALAGAEVVALCGTRAASVASLADQFGVPRRYVDWREMLADGELDAISICTPPVLHCEMTVAAAQAGCHVLVEKPMTLSLAECDQMIGAAERAGVLLMVAHNQRFSTRQVLAKEILDAGRLGKVYQAHAVFGHGGPERWSPRQNWYFEGQLAGYGVLSDLGIHKVDLLRWLLNQDVAEVAGFSAVNEKPTTANDTVVLALRFDGGTLATVHVSWVHRPGVVDSVTLSCERGTLEIPSSVTEPVRVREQRANGLVVESSVVSNAAATPGWQEEIAAFVDAVAHGKPSPVPGVEGRKTMAAILAAYEAIADKRNVQLSS